MKLTDLSKICSLALRHKPKSFNLELDKNGWIDVSVFLLCLNNFLEEKIYLRDLNKMIEDSKKKRHEIKEGKIRAKYGHSLIKNIKYESKIPKTQLYHGTSIENWSKIKESGLKPMCRQYVHLTTNIELAISTAKRKSKEIIILKINITKANKKKVNFYKVDEDIWLSSEIPSDVISPIN